MSKKFRTMILPDNGLTRFFDQAATHELLTADQEADLIQQLDEAWSTRHTDKGWRVVPPQAVEIINEITKHNIKLVIGVAAYYKGRGVPFEDLIQEGYIGLVRGIVKFEATQGVRLSTYITYWIRQSIDRAVMTQRGAIRIPVHHQYRYQQIRQAMANFGDKDYTVAEIAVLLDLTETQVSDNLALMSKTNALSLDEPGGDRDDMDCVLGDLIAGDEPAPLDEASSSELRECIDELLDGLEPREAQIVRYRFGLNDGYAQTLNEVGKKFGLTRERIRQIEKEALRKLRHPRRARILKGYV